MPPQISVALLPKLTDPQSVAGQTVVVTDVLRATTTIISALSNGLRQVIPTPTIPLALELKEQLGPDVILGGERGGVIIPGFHQGNSPREFTPQLVRGRDLVLCTTNGTVAMEACRGAERVLIGALVNLSAIVAELQTAARAMVICAGTDGKVTSEDSLFAGAVVARLVEYHQGAVALGWWQAANLRMAQGESLAEILGQGLGGRNLLRLKYDEDVRFCAAIDRLPFVPELDTGEWRIRLKSPKPD
ncbi:MAG: 2-phosphosulfolactate phosphatase [Planctomycetota bacterium]